MLQQKKIKITSSSTRNFQIVRGDLCRFSAFRDLHLCNNVIYIVYEVILMLHNTSSHNRTGTTTRITVYIFALKESPIPFSTVYSKNSIVLLSRLLRKR